MKLTPSQLKALTILKDTTMNNMFSAAGFAKLMWPDSSMHTKVSNQGNGACRGKAAWLAGGSYLAKLRAKGWVRSWCGHDYGHYITREGLIALKGPEKSPE